jgi:hypothetical protein
MFSHLNWIHVLKDDRNERNHETKMFKNEKKAGEKNITKSLIKVQIYVNLKFKES